jgi:hypothetical protein
MVIIKIDRHEADRTDAYTRWKIKLPSGEVLKMIDAREKGIVKLIRTSATLNKTHWFEWWEVPENAELIRIRMSNRGNLTKTIYKPQDLKAELGDC